MVDHDLLHQRQPEPRPLGLGREEGIEDLAQIPAVDPGARIGDAHHHPARPAILDHRDGQLLRGRPRQRLARVAHQVDERLPQLRFVRRQLRQIWRDVDRQHDPLLHQLPSGQRDDRGDQRPQILALELWARQPGEPQVGLGDLGQPIHLADDRSHHPSRLVGARRELVAQELRVEPDRRQRVAHLVGDLRRHSPHGRQPLGADQFLLALLDGVGHGVELPRQIADLVVRGDAGALRVLATRHLAGAPAQHAERPQRAQGEEKDRQRDRQPGGAQHDRHRERRLLVVGEPLGNLPVGAAQRLAHPIEPVDQGDEVALELGPRARINGRRRRAQLAGQRVELPPERRDLPPPQVEVTAPGRARLLFQVAVDGPHSVVELLARRPQRQRQVRVEPVPRPSERRSEVVERLPGRVDRPLQLEVGLVGDDPLSGPVNRQQREGGITGESQQQNAEGEPDLAENPQPHANSR